MARTQNQVPKLLWTTIPERLNVPRPTMCAGALLQHEGRALLALHPHIDVATLPYYFFGDQQPSGGTVFQAPGEGPWRFFPPWSVSPFARDTPTDVETQDPRRRIEVAFRAAATLGALCVDREPNTVVWELGGAYNGVVAAGMAYGVGRAVCVSAEQPDRLTIALCDAHGVKMRVVKNAMDQFKARSFLAAF